MMTLTSTRVLVTVQIMADDSAAADLVYLLAFVTGLVPLLAQAARQVEYIAGWVADITAAVIFTTKVMTIGFKSLAYGFAGVTL